MKTIEIKLYKFSELSEDAKQNAIEKLYDINVDYDWYQFVYEDAENIGLKITGFDIDRANFCNGKFTEGVFDVANSIIKEHGEDCETYKTAQSFLKDVEESSFVHNDIDNIPDVEFNSLEEEFLKSLLEDYRIILQKEYEYLTSKEAIIESIEANDYDFTGDGKLY